MSTETNVVPEGNTEPSGAGKETNSHLEKILKEKKNAMERVRELETKLKEESDAKLIEKENWKTLAEMKDKEAKEWQEKYTSAQRLIEDSAKISEIRTELSKLGLNQGYMDVAMKLADTTSVVFDKENKIVTGAENVARMIREKVPVFFQKTNPGVDHSAPAGSPGKLTIEDFKKLPLDEKRKREKELYENMGIKLKA